MIKTKLLTNILLLCICILFINIGCKKEEVAAKAAEPFVVKIDNIQVVIKNVTVAIKENGENLPFLLIEAYPENGDHIYLIIYHVMIGDKAIIDVTNNEWGSFFFYTTKEGKSFEASQKYAHASGKIIITKNDLSKKRIEGTFAGVATATDSNYGTKNFTDGSFALNY